LIAFFQTGGLGDAILGIAPMKKLVENYGNVIFLYYDHLVPQVMQGIDGIVSMRMVKETRPTIGELRRIVPEANMIVANKFMRDHEGMMNFFVPLDEEMEHEAQLRREVHNKAFYRDFGCSMHEPSIAMRIISMMNSESNYFSEWHRYGMDVRYEDVNVPIHQYTTERNFKSISNIGDYVIVHDSRLLPGTNYMKAWDVDKWGELCGRLSSHSLSVIQFVSPGQELFSDCVIPHYDIIGRDAMFQDYLDLLSGASLYIGTDSWPGHAAVFTNGPQYILLKGSVSKRWDHDGRFSKIIRKGRCQACEGPPSAVHSCLWGLDGSCMSSISVEDVMRAVEDGV
jgi:hypothetical protein